MLPPSEESSRRPGKKHTKGDTAYCITNIREGEA
jgi:hypothetical protein